MTNRILFVDDEERVLQAIKRTLHKDYKVETAEGGRQALDILSDSDDFAIVVSDMQMPEMTGLELLTEIKNRWPNIVRLMLTGNNDQETAVQAVNTGEVFRFMNKPCNPDILRATLKLALRQFELVTAEKQLLEQTLRGSIRAVSEILAITKPEIFGAMSRIRGLAVKLAESLKIDDPWQLDTAAMLCQLGCVSLSEATMKKVQVGARLSREEEQSFDAHPLLGADLISNIPRLEQVANIILYQNKNYDGTGFPRDNIKGEQIPIGARILRLVVDMDHLHSAKWSDTAALEELGKARGKYDPAIVSAMAGLVESRGAAVTRRVNVGSLVDGMIIEEEVMTNQDVLLVCAGQPVTPAIRQHLQKFVASGSLAAPILVSDQSTDECAAA